MITVLTAFGLAYLAYWCRFRDGKQKMIEGLRERQRKNEAIKALPDDRAAIKRKIQIQILMVHTGAPDDEPEAVIDVEKQTLINEANESSSDVSQIENQVHK